MSKLPDFFQPIGKFMLYGVDVDDMDREDLLKVIKWQRDQIESLQESEQEVRDRLQAEVVKTLGPPPKFSKVAKWIKA